MFFRIDNQRLIIVSNCKKAPSYKECRLNDIVIYKMYALADALLRIKDRQFPLSPFLHLPNGYTQFLLLIRLPSVSIES